MSDAAALLKRTRTGAGLTQTDLAARMGTTQTAIARMERPGANPTIGTLRRAVAATGNRLELGSVPLSSGVDETLIARNLRMTPAERLAAFETAHSEVEQLKRLMPNAG